MKLFGGIHLDDSGMHKSVRAMHLQQNTMGIIKDNIAGFNKVGYQKDVPIVTSFAEYFGTYALSRQQDDEVGRIKFTKNDLDVALAHKGYFQVQTPDGIMKLSRDGRFKLDKEGNLLTLEDLKVLSTDGQPIKFNKIPQDLKNIKIESNGQIKVFERDGLKFEDIGNIAVVDADSNPIKDVNMKQGYIEESNVVLHEEAYSLVTVRRNFQANRQLFIQQNSNLSKLLQDLGRA